MQFLILVLSLFMPFLQPIVQHGAGKVHQKLGIPQPPMQPGQAAPMLQATPPQYGNPTPPQYHFDGVRWYKFENGQTYVWTGPDSPVF